MFYLIIWSTPTKFMEEIRLKFLIAILEFLKILAVK